MLADLQEGRQYSGSTPWIWSVTLAFAVFNATKMGFWQILGPLITNDTIGAQGWGLVLSARGVGVVWETANFTHIPEHLLVRVGSHDEFWSTASFPTGTLTAPVLIAAFGTAAVAISGAGVAAAAMLLTSLLPSVRRITLNIHNT